MIKMEEEKKLCIALVRESNVGQKIITVPKECKDIVKGVYVKIEKVEKVN